MNFHRWDTHICNLFILLWSTIREDSQLFCCLTYLNISHQLVVTCHILCRTCLQKNPFVWYTIITLCKITSNLHQCVSCLSILEVVRYVFPSISSITTTSDCTPISACNHHCICWHRFTRTIPSSTLDKR